MEQTKNEGQVALEMGNSPKVVKDHYFEIVDERAANEYWSVKPSRADRKIVAIAQLMHVYVVKPRMDKRDVDLISDALPFRSAVIWLDGRKWMR